jgi:hypothetical protein
MKTGGFSLIRIGKLLGIVIVLLLAVLYIDYQFGLRKTPEALTKHVKTRHFSIYTDIEDEKLKHYENFFEGFYDYFNKEYFEIGQKRPLKIYLFKGDESYRPYQETVRGPRTPYGFYMGPWANIIVVNHSSGLGTATHELVHHFTKTTFVKNPPKWAYEGISVFFEKFIGHFEQDGSLVISFGYFSNWRFPDIKKRVKWLSLDDMVSSDQPDQSAAGALMLFLHKKGLFKEYVKQLRKVSDDPNGVKTLEKLYGSPLNQIEKDLKDWIVNQPIDSDVMLVESSFVLPADKWQAWLQRNGPRLYWSQEEQIYRVKN